MILESAKRSPARTHWLCANSFQKVWWRASLQPLLTFREMLMEVSVFHYLLVEAMKWAPGLDPNLINPKISVLFSHSDVHNAYAYTSNPSASSILPLNCNLSLSTFLGLSSYKWIKFSSSFPFTVIVMNQGSLVDVKMGSEITFSRFKSQLCHLLAVQYLASFWTSLSFSFLIHKIGKMTYFFIDRMPGEQ